jgi:hypothetical protein
MGRNEVQFKGNRLRCGFCEPENASVFDAFLALPHAAQYDFFRFESHGVPFPNYRRIVTGVAEGIILSSLSGILQPAVERLVQDRVRGVAWAITCRIAAWQLRRDAGARTRLPPVNAARANGGTRGREWRRWRQPLPDRGQAATLTGGADRVGVHLPDCGQATVPTSRRHAARDNPPLPPVNATRANGGTPGREWWRLSATHHELVGRCVPQVQSARQYAKGIDAGRPTDHRVPNPPPRSIR